MTMSAIFFAGTAATISTDVETTDVTTMVKDNQTGDERKWQAGMEGDTGQDGRFGYAVGTTGGFCRASGASRRPLRENVLFFEETGKAEQAGFRACLRCRPQAAADARSTNVRAVCRYIERHLDEPVSLRTLGDVFGMSPFHLQRTFKAAL